MNECEWKTARLRLIAGISEMPPAQIALRDGRLLKIGAASAEHAEAINVITHQAFEQFKDMLDPPNGSLQESAADVAGVMEEGGALIGYIDEEPVASLRITVYPDHFAIGRVGVVPTYRSKGIGTAMIMQAERLAANLQFTEVRLGTREKLTENVALYLKLGYRIVGIHPHPRGTDMVVQFSKQLHCNG